MLNKLYLEDIFLRLGHVPVLYLERKTQKPQNYTTQVKKGLRYWLFTESWDETIRDFLPWQCKILQIVLILQLNQPFGWTFE